MNTSCKKLFFLIFAIAALQTGKLGAQADVVDKIVMLDGEEKKGQVTEMGDTYIKFVHQGETLTYTVKKEEINKIQFSSGRVEFITESKKESPGNPLQSSMQSHHNLVAILPFSYIGLGGSRDEKMAIKAQADCYSYFQKNAGQFSYQDPITTNAILIKHGMNGDNIKGFTSGELAAMLGT